jgi:hypothetical protein
VGTLPGLPQNPDWILGDTDALIQLVACDKLSILRTLKTDYGISTVIPDAVEIELRNIAKNRKFQDVEHLLVKAFKVGLLTVLDEKNLATLVGAKAPEVLGRIEQRGDSFKRLGVGNGEAYAHAACIELNLPILTNDSMAIEILMANGSSPPGPYFRTFDVIVFGRQIDALTDNECDSARQSLANRNEAINRCFTGRSFADGLPEFYQRLIDSAAPILGSRYPQHRYDSKRLTIRVQR